MSHIQPPAQVLIKPQGSCQWEVIAGGHHPEWKDGCVEDALPPVETPPPPAAPAPVEEAACKAWKVQIWHTHITSLNAYVRPLTPPAGKPFQVLLEWRPTSIKQTCASGPAATTLCCLDFLRGAW